MTYVRSIVIPCYNERTRLPPTLETILQFISTSGVSTEIVIVDDGSQDGTANMVRSLIGRFPFLRVLDYTPNRGKGYAVKRGVLAAQGDFILFMDADGATPIAESTRFWPLLEQGQADLVAGSRKLVGARIEAAQAPIRRWASSFFGFLTRLLVLRGMTDTQCGFKAMSRQAAMDLFPQIDNSTEIFDIELFMLAARNGYRIAELPVVWKHDPDSRITYNLMRSIRVFTKLLHIKWRHRLLLPISISTLRP